MLGACTKSGDMLGVEEYVASDDLISFDNEALTKGAVATEESFAEMELHAFYTYSIDYCTITDVSSLFTTLMDCQLVKRSKEGDVYSDWTYYPYKYWPNNTNSRVTFFAFAPYGAITRTDDADKAALPYFSYTHTALASESVDLLYDANFDEQKSSSSGSITFDMQHLMSRLSLYGKLSGDVADGTKYYINGITLFGIHSKMNFATKADQTGYEWTIDSSLASIDYAITQGKSLLSVVDEGNCLTTESLALCVDDTAIFVLPQDVSEVTLQVRILVVYSDGTSEIISSSNEIPMPTYDNSGTLAAGEWTKLSFEFDPEKIDDLYVEQMTVKAEAYEWTETEVDAEIHKNIYIYSSKQTIEAELDEDDGSLYGEFMICTNYDYNLRVPHHHVELDGEITSSRGFLFYTDDFNNVSGTTNEVDTYTDSDGNVYKIFVPTLLSIEEDGEGNKSTEQITYATEKNTATFADDDPIYEYPDGYNNEDAHSAIEGATKASIKYGSSNGYAYLLDDGLYRLLYIDPKTECLTAFNYYDEEDNALYHEIKLTNFSADGTVYFKIVIGDIDNDQETADYSFDFQVEKSTREELSLYTSTAINGDNSYGVNKEGSDPVYTLRLSVNTEHLTIYNGFQFDDFIGVEMISNGGGMMTQLFSVLLTYDGITE